MEQFENNVYTQNLPLKAAPVGGDENFYEHIADMRPLPETPPQPPMSTHLGWSNESTEPILFTGSVGAGCSIQYVNNGHGNVILPPILGKSPRPPAYKRQVVALIIFVAWTLIVATACTLLSLHLKGCPENEGGIPGEPRRIVVITNGKYLGNTFPTKMIRDELVSQLEKLLYVPNKSITHFDVLPYWNDGMQLTFSVVSNQTFIAARAHELTKLVPQGFVKLKISEHVLVVMRIMLLAKDGPLQNHQNLGYITIENHHYCPSNTRETVPRTSLLANCILTCAKMEDCFGIQHDVNNQCSMFLEKNNLAEISECALSVASGYFRPITKCKKDVFTYKRGLSRYHVNSTKLPFSDAINYCSKHNHSRLIELAYSSGHLEAHFFRIIAQEIVQRFWVDAIPNPSVTDRTYVHQGWLWRTSKEKVYFTVQQTSRMIPVSPTTQASDYGLLLYIGIGREATIGVDILPASDHLGAICECIHPYL